jgi:hypothetical protein
MSKPGADPASGISLGDVLRLPKRHPAWRRREPQSGSCTERENLAGDAKGKGASGSNREAESTDAPERGGLPCSSDEAGVMLVERRGQVTDVGSEPTGNRRSSNSRRKAAAFARWHEPDDARVSSPDVCPGKASMFSRGQSCRGRSQSPVVRIAEGMETEPTKPIDKISLGEINESPGRNNNERVVASKVSKSEGRAFIRRAKAT